MYALKQKNEGVEGGKQRTTNYMVPKVQLMMMIQDNMLYVRFWYADVDVTMCLMQTVMMVGS